MKLFVPYRIKLLVAEKFPLLYYCANRLSFNVNDPGYWDERLKTSWNDPKRSWPTKNKLIMQITEHNQQILDIACGNGSILRYLKHEGYMDLHGLECSAYAISVLSSQGIQMHYSRLPKIDLPSEAFDVIIASEILEHLVKRHTFTKEISRILKPGGRVIFSVPDNCLGPIDEKEHVRKYTMKSLQTFLGKYFSIMEITSIKDINHNCPTIFCVAKKLISSVKVSFRKE